jgi:hypothetical protein
LRSVYISFFFSSIHLDKSLGWTAIFNKTVVRIICVTIVAI